MTKRELGQEGKSHCLPRLSVPSSNIMKLIETIQHTSHGKDYEIQVCGDGQIYSIAAYHNGIEIVGIEPEEVTKSIDEEFLTFNGLPYRNEVIQRFKETLDQGKLT